MVVRTDFQEDPPAPALAEAIDHVLQKLWSESLPARLGMNRQSVDASPGLDAAQPDQPGYPATNGPLNFGDGHDSAGT